jgi:prepilin-type N-terminal cleavage/methylation domain-containing protein
MKQLIKTRGFTLIETLIVVGIIGVLAAIVLVAINPARQFAQANNAQRVSNLNAILNAVGQRLIDNRGTFEDAGGTCNVTLPTATTTMSSTGGYNIAPCLIPVYLPALPFDPKTGSYADIANYNTGYTIVKDLNGRITVTAPAAELGDRIEVTR